MSIEPVPSQQVIDFRESFGLPVDREALETANKGADPRSGVEFGIPLTEAEYDTVVKRSAQQELTTDAIAFARDRPSHFGYPVLLPNGGLSVPAASDTPEELIQQIRERVPADIAVEFPKTSFTGSEIGQWRDNLIRMVAEPESSPGQNVAVALRDRDIAITSAGPSADHRLALRVGVTKVDEPLIRSIWDSVNASFAEPLLPEARDVEFTEEPGATALETRNDSPGPLKAGLALSFPGAGTCTSNLSVIRLGVIAQMTAGHCLHGGTSDTVFAGGQAIGTKFHGWFTSGTYADVGLVQLSPGGLASPYAFSRSGTSTSIESISSIRQANQIAVNQTVCVGGAQTVNRNCGPITSVDVSYVHTPPDAYVVNGAYFASYTAEQGDSGALSERAGVGVGILTAKITAVTRANSPIATAMTVMGFGATPLTAFSGQVSGWGLLVSQHSGGCVDVAYNQTANGTGIWNWGCDGGPAQRWAFVAVGTFNGDVVYELRRPDYPTKCLDLDIAVGNNGMDNGTRVQEWDCNSGSNQRWTLQRVSADRSFFRIISRHSGNCLDLDIGAGPIVNGSGINSWDCLSANTNQQWRIA